MLEDSTDDCEVTLTLRPTEYIPPVKAALVISFLHNILYMRGLVPLPIVQLTTTAISKDRSKEKKRLHLISEIETLSNLIDSLCCKLHDSVFCLTSASIIIGSSASTPREVYHIHFDQCQCLSASNEPINIASVADKARRLLIRNVLGYWQTVLKKAPFTKTYVALQISKPGLNEVDESMSLFRLISSVPYFESLFVPKLKLSTRLRKSSPKPLNMTIQATGLPAEASRLERNRPHLLVSNSSSALFVLKCGMKGLREL